MFSKLKAQYLTIGEYPYRKIEGDGKAGDGFWTKAETLLYCAFFGYIHYEAPEEEQNFNTLLEFLNASEVREDDEDYENPVDMMFHDLEKKSPNHFAVRQYRKYKLAEGFENHISFIRDLQELRSTGTGHRKGKGYIKISEKFGLSDTDKKSDFERILNGAIAFLDYMDSILGSID